MITFTELHLFAIVVMAVTSFQSHMSLKIKWKVALVHLKCESSESLRIFFFLSSRLCILCIKPTDVLYFLFCALICAFCTVVFSLSSFVLFCCCCCLPDGYDIYLLPVSLYHLFCILFSIVLQRQFMLVSQSYLGIF